MKGDPTLKACPFCGGRARIQAYDSWCGPWVRVMCTIKACAARGPTVTRRHFPSEPDAAQVRNLAAFCWNNRPQIELAPDAREAQS